MRPRPARPLVEERLDLVPTAVLEPGLTQLLARLPRPFRSGALHVIAADSLMGSAQLREFPLASCPRSLLLAGTEGKAFADPRPRPLLEYVPGGECHMPFDAQSAASR